MRWYDDLINDPAAEADFQAYMAEQLADEADAERAYEELARHGDPILDIDDVPF